MVMLTTIFNTVVTARLTQQQYMALHYMSGAHQKVYTAKYLKIIPVIEEFEQGLSASHTQTAFAFWNRSYLFIRVKCPQCWFKYYDKQLQ